MPYTIEETARHLAKACLIREVGYATYHKQKRFWEEQIIKIMLADSEGPKEPSGLKVKDQRVVRAWKTFKEVCSAL